MGGCPEDSSFRFNLRNATIGSVSGSYRDRSSRFNCRHFPERGVSSLTTQDSNPTVDVQNLIPVCKFRERFMPMRVATNE